MVEKEKFPKQILPLEVDRLYTPYLERTKFLADCTPVEPGVNLNQHQAADEILTLMGESAAMKEGLTVGLLGTMGAGKTTTICLLANHLEVLHRAVYKHSLDFARTGSRLINHTGDVWVEAELYESLAEIDSQEPILLIDEFQFENKSSIKEIRDFLSERRDRGKFTIVSQLDFDFRREPWKNTQILLPCLDRIFVLQAKCEDCGRPAYFPQRDVDGQPAHINDSLVMVGAEELYTPKCGCCHQVQGK